MHPSPLRDILAENIPLKTPHHLNFVRFTGSTQTAMTRWLNKMLQNL